jgi:hypothetical protein
MRLQTHTPSTSRRSERESRTIPISLVRRSQNFGKDDEAMTIDISMHGMRIRTALPLAAEEWVEVIATKEFPHTIPAQVVWAREEESSHSTLAGIEFLPALST